MTSVATPAEPDASDAGQADLTTTDRTVVEIEQILRNLKNLEKNYHGRASDLPHQHIGVYIEEICNIVSSISLTYPDRNHHVRFLIRSIFNFVLDQFEDRARLDELDQNKMTPLHVATIWHATDCLELLLARGADPFNTLGDDTPHQAVSNLYRKRVLENSYRSELAAMFVLRNLIKLWQESRDSTQGAEYFSMAWVTGFPRYTKEAFVEISLGQMLSREPWMTSDQADEHFRAWIHVPFTNIPVLHYICRAIEGLVNRNTPQVDRAAVLVNFCLSIRTPLITPGNPLLNYRDSMFRSTSKDGKIIGRAMVFPFMILERIRTVRSIRARYAKAQASPSMYGLAVPPLLGICLDRTLDEAYFPSMDEAFFETRNKDQVVSKEWQRASGSPNIEDAPILLVPQIWLWTFGSVILSAYSNKRTSSSFNVFVPYNEHKLPHFFGRNNVPSLELQMGLIVASQILEFGEEHDRENEGSKFKSALHMFETAVISALSRVQQYLDAGPSSYTISQQKKKEQMFIHTMSDIHGELDMISSVLEQQKKVMDQFLDSTLEQRQHSSGEEAVGWSIVMNTRKSLDEYESRVQKIHRDADRVEKTIESYLNLKRTYASIEDTRNSLMVGFAATAFAFVTVIFTPLSFMTSLFALPVSRFAKNQVKSPDTEAYVFRPAYIGGYTGMCCL
ncbi:hypothetical protein DE146DRAFT_638948 [Phaeosphaeria sp. MPI-PUGE-AT-0046c]|nr:hypothetical protein DE146DRAFT_638948 [Phaeosphaeria sp. MPI-PUGE-AT-0046c]